MHEKKNVSLFDFNGHQVRVVDRDGEPWFVAKDVCDVLGFETARRGTWHTLRGLGDAEKRLVKTPRQGRGNPSVTAIAESGLYKLVMRSNKPNTKAFQDWVTGTVLPAIRKDGAYVTGEEKLAKLRATTARRNEARKAARNRLRKRPLSFRPAAHFAAPLVVP